MMTFPRGIKCERDEKFASARIGVWLIASDG